MKKVTPIEAGAKQASYRARPHMHSACRIKFSMSEIWQGDFIVFFYFLIN